MDATLFLELRFPRTPDGSVWTAGGYSYPFWSRYLEVFARLTVVARVLDVPAPEPGWRRVDGDRVSVAGVPHYIGPAQFARRALAVRRAVHRATEADGAMLLRSGLLSAVAARVLQAAGRPYAMEVVGDPYDVFAPGAVGHPLRAGFRWGFTREQQRQCAWAAGALYVTERTLQARYPCPALMAGVSDVELGPDALAAVPRVWPARARRRVVFVGTLGQLYKGPDVLVKAVARSVRAGLDLGLCVVGDGAYRQHLEASARREGLSGRAEFLGELSSGRAVRDQLDRADLFVLPSRTEGMPRALIEAMARGLPCIASRVGGIPELLGEDALVPPDDVVALAGLIERVVTDPARMAAMSARNLHTARRYAEHVLHARRLAFYEHVREQTRRETAR